MSTADLRAGGRAKGKSKRVAELGKTRALHARVCDFLAEPHHVGLLPLLAVNRHLRKLATKRLVAAYSKAVCKGWSEDGVTLKIVGGGFVRLTHNWVNPFNGPEKHDDPRYAITKHYPENAEYDELRPLDLIFDSFNADTRMCKFKPYNKFLDLQWNMDVDRTTRMPQPEFYAGVFNMTPTEWFRREQKGEQGVKGLLLAIDPTAYPPYEACFYPGISAKIDGKIDALSKPVYHGWKITYHASRSDRMLTELLGEMLAESEALPAEDSDLAECIPVAIPASCRVEALKIPLVNLFVPPGWSKKRPWWT